MKYLVQGSDDWLFKRKSCITGTDCAVIMGNSPYMTPLQLWEQKKGLRPEPEMNAAMMRGKELEPFALKWIEGKTGHLLFPMVKFHEERTWQMASLDAMSMDESVMFEIKCGKKSFAQAREGIVPPYYNDQLQHQMCVTGLDKVTYVAFDGFEGILIDVKRDDGYIKKLIEKEEMFYGYLQRNEPPPETESPVIDVVAEPEVLLVVSEWLRWTRIAKEASTRAEELRPHVLDLGDDGDFDITDLEGFRLVKARRIKRPGNVDWKALCKDRGISDTDLAKYRKPDSYHYTVVPYDSAGDL